MNDQKKIVIRIAAMNPEAYQLAKWICRNREGFSCTPYCPGEYLEGVGEIDEDHRVIYFDGKQASDDQLVVLDSFAEHFMEIQQLENEVKRENR